MKTAEVARIKWKHDINFYQWFLSSRWTNTPLGCMCVFSLLCTACVPHWAGNKCFWVLREKKKRKRNSRDIEMPLPRRNLRAQHAPFNCPRQEPCSRFNWRVCPSIPAGHYRPKHLEVGPERAMKVAPRAPCSQKFPHDFPLRAVSDCCCSFVSNIYAEKGKEKLEKKTQVLLLAYI